MFKIVRVVVRLKGRSALGKLDLARFVVIKMTGNLNFPSLAAQVTTLGNAADALESAITAANTGDHEAIGLKDLAEAELELVLAKLCDAINGIALGDKAKLLTCGLPLRKENTPYGELDPPTLVASKFTTTSGRVALVFKGSRGALTYNVYQSDTSEPYKWVLIGNTSKRKFNVDGLTPGTFSNFAVSAVGTAGESSKSEPARAMAAA
ncbi:MAG: fibronectin type III domain-containing protein [Flavobacteriales bacterium]